MHVGDRSQSEHFIMKSYSNNCSNKEYRDEMEALRNISKEQSNFIIA